MEIDWTINNCKQVFRCPKTWEKLNGTANQAVRFCQECKRHVFLCRTFDELDYHLERLHCIAILAEPVASNTRTEEIIFGQSVSPDYEGPTMTLRLAATDNLSQEQLDYLSWAFALGAADTELRNQLCDGKEHILCQGVPVEMAESLSERLASQQIKHQFMIDPG